MEFKIKHTTPFFNIMMFVCFGLWILTLIVLGFLWWNFSADVLLAFLWIMGGELAAALLFLCLHLTERIVGGKIIIEEDAVVIKLLLRKKRIPFSEIEDSDFTHYEEYYRRTGTYNSSVYVKKTIRNLGGKSRYWRLHLRSMLEFYLVSGKTITLTDDAPGYKKGRELARTHSDYDPNTEIRLYQAWQCYKSARDVLFEKTHPQGTAVQKQHNFQTKSAEMDEI